MSRGRSSTKYKERDGGGGGGRKITPARSHRCVVIKTPFAGERSS